MSGGGSAEAAQPRRFLRSIQHLRAIAASMVVLHHSAEIYPDAFIARLDWGQAGVATFFVISGFIIWTSSRPETASQFAWRRLVRIVPMYWLALLLTVLQNREIWGQGLYVPATLVKSLLFIPYFGYGDNAFIFPILVPSWTLYIEMMFYALFWAGMVLGRPLAVSASVLCGFVLLGALGLNQSAPLMLYSKWICLLFVAGMLLARYAADIRLGATLSWIVAGALLVTLWTTMPLPPFALGIGTIFLVLGCIAHERAQGWPLLRWLGQLGDASFAIYLFHLPVISLLDLGLSRLITAPLPWAIYGPLCLAAAWSSGLLIHRWIERPLGGWLRRRIFPG